MGPHWICGSISVLSERKVRAVSDRQLGITDSPRPPNVRSPKADRPTDTEACLRCIRSSFGYRNSLSCSWWVLVRGTVRAVADASLVTHSAFRFVGEPADAIVRTGPDANVLHFEGQALHLTCRIRPRRKARRGCRLRS